jgi:hypothetical protein
VQKDVAKLLDTKNWCEARQRDDRRKKTGNAMARERAKQPQKAEQTITNGIYRVNVKNKIYER